MASNWRAKALLVLAAVGVAGLSGEAGSLAAPDLYPGAETVDVYWMSGVIYNGRACVGSQWLHGYNAYDLIADNLEPCWDHGVPVGVSLRTLGRSSTPHATLRATMYSGSYPPPRNCDYIEARTVQGFTGELRTYRYLHATGTTGQWVDIWAGPSLLPTETSIGSTSTDSDCRTQTGQQGWFGYHTHQDSGASSPWSQPNTGLPTDDDIPVWDPAYWIHKWTYPLPDTDGDGFQDAAEAYVGTDRWDACADGWWDDAWPADLDNDTWCDVGDILEFEPHIMCSVGDACYDNRFDLTTDGWVDVGDILMLRPFILTSCA